MKFHSVLPVVAVLLALFACALAAPQPPAEIEEFVQRLRLPDILPQVNNVAEQKNYRPVVFMHGLGDTGDSSGIQKLCKAIMTKYPGSYATSISVADGTSSYTTAIDEQVKQFTKAVQSDSKLSKGFNLVGISQGGIIARSYINLSNSPPVYNFVSLNGVQNGVGECPSNIPEFLCSIFKSSPYTYGFSFSGYWKDVTDKDTYLKKSPFLADVNNEREQKNEQYKNNLMSLNKMVLVMALNDTVVIPKESEQFGFYAWGDPKSIVQVRDTEAFQGDWLGLQSMDKNSQLDFLEFEGDHLKFSQEFWDNKIMPYFDNTFDD